MPCGLFTIHKLFRCGVPENNVSDLVERGFMRESGKRIHRNLATEGEALNVAVQLIKWRTREGSFGRPKPMIIFKASTRLRVLGVWHALCYCDALMGPQFAT